MPEVEEFKFLAIKNWEKFQPKNKKPFPWIRDYKDKDFDPEFMALTMLQRYVMDGCCRLRARFFKNLRNDPMWIARALCVLPEERRFIGQAIAVLCLRGFLIPTNQEDGLLEEIRGEEKREEEGRKEEPNQPTPEPVKPPDGSDIKIEQIAQAHPKFRKPVETEREIVMQLDRLGDRMGVESAMKYLLEKTLRYSQAYKRWNTERQRFSPESPRWFHAGCFDEDPTTWETEEKGNGKVEQSTAGTSTAVAAGVDKFLRRKAAMGSQDVPGAVTPKPGNPS